MKRHRYRGVLGKRHIATVEQVVVSAGEGDSELRERALHENAARLEQVIFALLKDLGMPPNDSPFGEDPHFWFQAFFRLAKRHVPGMAPLKMPGTVGRPVAPEEEEVDGEVDTAILAQPDKSVRAVCEELARQKLGTDASADAVRKLGAKWRQRYHDRRRR